MLAAGAIAREVEDQCSKFYTARITSSDTAAAASTVVNDLRISSQGYILITSGSGVSSMGGAWRYSHVPQVAVQTQTRVAATHVILPQPNIRLEKAIVALGRWEGHDICTKHLKDEIEELIKKEHLADWIVKEVRKYRGECPTNREGVGRARERE
ncbi:hypothetical protein AgCh_024004 [Apium graveolens]